MTTDLVSRLRPVAAEGGGVMRSCYCAWCPACDGMVAVAVAPIDEPDTLAVAIKHRRQWERKGLRVGVVTVGEIWGGAFTGHAKSCRHGRRRLAQGALPFNGAMA